MILASKTMAAIDSAMTADQGAAFRGHLANLMPLAGDAYSTKQEDWRNHLGASLIGRECSRELWYSFHWATRNRFDGRMLRLFNRGHLEEPRMIAMLLTIGCQVWQVDANGKQFRVDGHRGHFGGSLDGVVLGIPEAPDQPVLAEFKTHGEKSFLKLQGEGVMKAKWEHFVQMQIYMGKNNLQLAIYMAVNKNTDELHAELVQFDQREYDRALARSVAIIEAVEPPPKLNPSPGFFKCKCCDHHKVCHLGAAPAVTCRSCVHSRVEDDGCWRCSEPMADAAYGDVIDLDSTAQRAACDSYSLNPVFEIKPVK
jgi:ribosomal protein S27E